MLPTPAGWITVDRSIVLLANAITDQIEHIAPLSNAGKSPSRKVADTSADVLIPLSQIESIETIALFPLVKAIKHDFPNWDGFSCSLKKIFQERRIDPKLKYNHFFSTKPTDIVASYTWKGRSLFELAGHFVSLNSIN